MCLYCIYRELIVVFFFNDTATTEIYTLSLHDALPISTREPSPLRVGLMLTDSCAVVVRRLGAFDCERTPAASRQKRSEEHTSELQSRQYLVCRLLLEKKKINDTHKKHYHSNEPTVQTL